MRDPKKTPAYNHFAIEEGKDVIPNLVFKNTYNSDNASEIKQALETYACDPLQKRLLTEKLLKLETNNQKNLPPL
jgi:hypothetical protein